MNKTDYEKALEAARAEFESLIRERVELDQRIVRLKQTITGLAGLCETDNDVARSINNIVPLAPRFLRLTSAIRQVMADEISPIRPPELRRALLEHGLSMDQYSNKLATIHNTLSRLERQGEVTEVNGGWTLTEKGKLASRMDSLDFTPAGGTEAMPAIPANGGSTIRSNDHRSDDSDKRSQKGSRKVDRI